MSNSEKNHSFTLSTLRDIDFSKLRKKSTIFLQCKIGRNTPPQSKITWNSHKKVFYHKYYDINNKSEDYSFVWKEPHLHGPITIEIMVWAHFLNSCVNTDKFGFAIVVLFYFIISPVLIRGNVRSLFHFIE